MMSPTMIRQLWTVVESTQVSTLLRFDDATLVQLLLKRFTAQQAIDTNATDSLSTYIHSKLGLIRDTADGRSD